jgi:FAD:protein FMN transferase
MRLQGNTAIVSPGLMPVLCLLAAAGGCGNRDSEPIVREAVAMNTYVTISVYESPLPVLETEARIDSALAEIRYVEDFASDYVDSSEVGRVNSGAGVRGISVSADLAWLVRRSMEYTETSGNAFNVTVGPLVKTWDFLAEHPRVPSPHVIDSLVRLVDVSAVQLRGDTLSLKKRGMRLDFGGIAKGHAVDRALQSLRRGGIRRAIVDLGGSLAIAWDAEGRTRTDSVTVGIRHPRKPGRLFGTFRTGSSGVATSGDYERCFILGGRRYHHILDPKTGYPVPGVVAVTILAPDGITADALGKVAFVLGREKGMAFIRSRPGVEALMIVEHGDSLRWLATPGMESRFTREPEGD